MLHELFLTHCTNGTSIMNPFTFIKDSYDHEALLEARKLEKLEIQLAKSRTVRGPNFAIVPKEPPVIEYVAAIEKACQQLKQGEAEELRGEIKSIIKKIHPPDLTLLKRNTKPYYS